MALSILRLDGQPGEAARDVVGEEVLIGSDPECAVVIRDAAVDGKHLKLTRGSDGYGVMCLGTKPVYMNKRRLETGALLQGRHEIRFGQDGPRLLLTFRPSGTETMVRRLRTGTRTLFLHLHKQVRSSRRVALASIVTLVVLAAAAVVIFRKQEQEAARLQVTLATFQDLSQARQVELAATLQHERERVESELTERMREREQAHEAELQKLREEWAAEANKLKEGLVPVVERVSPSVLVAGIKAADGTLGRLGTAWVVAEGVLATNAHVAGFFDALKPGETFCVRSSTNPPRDFRIVKVALHPLRRASKQAWVRHAPIDPETLGLLYFKEMGDVALMYVQGEDAGAVGTPLPLADEDRLRRLKPGTQLLSVGFPMQGLLGAGSEVDRPTPMVHTGVVTGIQDAFLSAQAQFEDRLVVSHSLPWLGGASGSPLLDTDGTVVAVHSSGHYEKGMAITGYKMSERVDLLRELLDGTVDRTTAARTKRIEEGLAARCVKDAAVWRATYLGQLPERLEELGVVRKASAELLFSRSGQIRTEGEAGSAVYEFKAPADGFYLAVAHTQALAEPVVMAARENDHVASLVQARRARMEDLTRQADELERKFESDHVPGAVMPDDLRAQQDRLRSQTREIEQEIDEILQSFRRVSIRRSTVATKLLRAKAGSPVPVGVAATQGRFPPPEEKLEAGGVGRLETLPSVYELLVYRLVGR